MGLTSGLTSFLELLLVSAGNKLSKSPVSNESSNNPRRRANHQGQPQHGLQRALNLWQHPGLRTSTWLKSLRLTGCSITGSGTTVVWTMGSGAGSVWTYLVTTVVDMGVPAVMVDVIGT